MQKLICIGGLMVGVLISSVVFAVGDLPLPLNRAEASKLYSSLLPLISADGMSCPGEATPISGVVTGGSSPAGGSQTTTLDFGGGASLKVMKTWTRTPAGTLGVKVQIECP